MRTFMVLYVNAHLRCKCMLCFVCQQGIQFCSASVEFFSVRTNCIFQNMSLEFPDEIYFSLHMHEIQHLKNVHTYLIIYLSIFVYVIIKSYVQNHSLLQKKNVNLFQ